MSHPFFFADMVQILPTCRIRYVEVGVAFSSKQDYGWLRIYPRAHVICYLLNYWSLRKRLISSIRHLLTLLVKIFFLSPLERTINIEILHRTKNFNQRSGSLWKIKLLLINKFRYKLVYFFFFLFCLFVCFKKPWLAHFLKIVFTVNCFDIHC